MASKPLYRRLKSPTTVQLEVTWRCQQRCCHCCNYWHGDEHLSSMSRVDGDLTLDAALKIVDQCIDAEVLDLVLTGGESLLNFEVAAEAALKAKRSGMRVSLNSNLVLIDQQKARFLSEHQIGVLASLLGPNAAVHCQTTRAPGSFDAAIRGFRILEHYGWAPNVNMVINRHNHRCVRETAKLVSSLGGKSLAVTPAICPAYAAGFDELGLSREEIVAAFDDLLWSRNEYGLRITTLNPVPYCTLSGCADALAFATRRCGAGIFQLVIAPDGSARACPQMKDAEGNVLEEGLTAVWQKMAHWTSADNFPADCLSCRLFAFCGGGCRFAAKMSSGCFAAMDPRSSPAQAKDVMEKFEQAQIERGQATDRFLVNDFRQRREDFGSIVAIGSDQNNNLIMSHAGAEFLAQLEVGNSYQTAAFPSAALSLLSVLSQRHLIDFLPQ